MQALQTDVTPDEFVEGRNTDDEPYRIARYGRQIVMVVGDGELDETFPTEDLASMEFASLREQMSAADLHP